MRQLLFWVAIDKVLFKLACSEDIHVHVHHILNELKFQLDLTTDHWSKLPLSILKVPVDV